VDKKVFWQPSAVVSLKGTGDLERKSLNRESKARQDERPSKGKETGVALGIR